MVGWKENILEVQSWCWRATCTISIFSSISPILSHTCTFILICVFFFNLNGNLGLISYFSIVLTITRHNYFFVCVTWFQYWIHFDHHHIIPCQYFDNPYVASLINSFFRHLKLVRQQWLSCLTRLEVQESSLNKAAICRKKIMWFVLLSPRTTTSM